MKNENFNLCQKVTKEGTVFSTDVGFAQNNCPEENIIHTGHAMCIVLHAAILYCKIPTFVFLLQRKAGSIL